jgi:hypothetical protein
MAAITAANTASGDLIVMVDVSDSLNKSITRDNMITATLNNATSLTGAMVSTDTATADQFLIYDVSATAMKDITRDELITTVANNLVPLTSALSGAATATDDTFLVYDLSALALKNITRTELIAAVAANLASQSIANAALQNGLVATTTFKVKSTGTAVTKLLSVATTLDFPNTLAVTSSDMTITVTGAAVGDAVFIGLPAAPTAGFIFQGFVSAADTVTIRATNFTAGALNPASATYRVTVVGF